MVRKTIAALLLAFLAIGVPASSRASVDDFHFDSMSVDYFLSRNADGSASLRTVETLVAEFPDYDQNHGIERAIPLRYDDVDLGLKIVSVTDAYGRSLNYSRSDDSGFAVLRIGDADRYVHGTQTYRIDYLQKNVVQHFSDTNADEFYWDINGTGWAQSFSAVKATLHLEGDLAADLNGDLSCYWGYYGDSNRCDISASGNVISSSVSDLSGYQTMTIAVGFKSNAFADPPRLSDAWNFSILPFILMGLTGAAFLFVLGLRIFVWRDGRPDAPIIARYSPPEEIYPLLAAHFLQKEKTGLTAQIVGLATEKVLVIRQFEKVTKNRRYELELLAGWPTVRPMEEHVLKALFKDVRVGEKVTLDTQDRKLGDRIATLNAKLPGEIQSWGLKYTPKSKWPKILRWFTFAIAVAAIVDWFFMSGLDLDIDRVWSAAFLCSVGWVVVSAMATIPQILTARGRKVRDHLRGVKLYLDLAEADRIRMLQAPDTAERIDVTDESAIIKLYERLLPYAIIFGIEDKWLAELGKHYESTETPSWYEGTQSIFAISTFSSSFTGNSFATTPPPSSSGSSWSSSGGSSYSGGSSGGGFSGGGGGGGGGGGW
ncbi:MAG: DUF2207 domain-containing protein [Cryobacterium sp.]|nr:DUF2207 domain-containing protein [Cryobacterium sp.]